MEILLTGATGFVGSHLARMLVEAGHSLRVLYRSPSKLAVLEGLRYQAIQGDLNDRQALERACAGCNILFHVAAKADYWKDDDKDALWRINVDGTRNVLAAARAAHIKRVIFTSSASTLGIRPGAELADESDRFDMLPRAFLVCLHQGQSGRSCCQVCRFWPGCRYAESKRHYRAGRSECHLRHLHYSDRPFPVGAAHFIGRRRGHRCSRCGAGACECHRTRQERRALPPHYTANYPYSEWFNLIAKACGVRPPIFTTPDFMLESTARLIDLLRRMGIETPLDANQARLGSSFVYFDGSKAHRDLFTPQIDIETSLQETWKWYLENGYIKQDILTRLIGQI